MTEVSTVKAITDALSDEETMENIDLDTEMRYNLPSKLGNQLQTGSPKSIWVIPVTTIFFTFDRVRTETTCPSKERRRWH
jgi:hypothetical protein